MANEALNIQDTTYSGSVASYFITRAVVGADTIEKGVIYVEDGIKKKKTIPRIENGLLFLISVIKFEKVTSLLFILFWFNF